MITSALKTLDECFFDVVAPYEAERRAATEGNREGIAEARLRRYTSHTYLGSLVFNTLRAISQFAIVFFRKFQETGFYQFVNRTWFVVTCNVLGFITNGITALYEGFNVTRQAAFVFLFHSKAWKDSRESLADDLQTLIDQPQTRLENRLRPWFVDKFVNKDVIEILIASIRLNDASAINSGKTLMAQVNCQAFKKMCMHLVGLFAAAIGLLSMLASMTFPPVAIALFLLSMAAYLTRYMISAGWVDNPHGGFSLRNCIPGFLQCCCPPASQQRAVAS